MGFDQLSLKMSISSGLYILNNLMILAHNFFTSYACNTHDIVNLR
jgi:hypothetical protein